MYQYEPTVTWLGYTWPPAIVNGIDSTLVFFNGVLVESGMKWVLVLIVVGIAVSLIWRLFQRFMGA